MITSNLRRFASSGPQDYSMQPHRPIDLSLTENPLGASVHAIAAVARSSSELSHYPAPFGKVLRGVVAEHLSVDDDMVAVGAGALEMIEDIVRAVVEPGDELVLPSLSFYVADAVASLCGGRVVHADMQDDLHIDFERLRVAVTDRTKVVFLCNPNNPTGLTEPASVIIDFAKSVDALLVVDEANIELGGESVIEYVGEIPNLVVVRTFSKAHGLAGLRVGYCVGEASFIRHLLMPPRTLPVASVAERAAIAALGDEDHIRRSRAHIAQERRFLEDALASRGFAVTRADANCFVAAVPPGVGTSTEFVQHLAEHGVSVVDGLWFPALGLRSVRIAPQLHPTNLLFLEAVDMVLEEAGVAEVKLLPRV